MRYLAILSVGALLTLSGCSFWDNFTTLFNTYYNAKRLMMETEDEFEYLSEKERVKPRVVVPGGHTLVDISRPDRETPEFLEEFVISKAKLQPVKAKVDSVLVKGSKILAKRPNSDYIDGTLFLMAKAFFYKGEWLPSQIKCQELLEKFPYSSFSPETHLFLAKNFFMQRQYPEGEQALSKAIDIAWGQKQYDILGEAFRLQAELSLYNEDLDGALRPYRRAIAQADDNTLRARWQCDLALLLYRKELFKEALKEFEKVDDYSPDLLTTFEKEMYSGAVLVELQRYDEANERFADLEDNGNYEEWYGYVWGERINMLRMQGLIGDTMQVAEVKADSAFSNNPQVASAYYRRALKTFKDGQYIGARRYFSRARGPRSPIKHIAARYVGLISTWEEKTKFALPLAENILKNNQGDDSLRLTVAGELFEVGRVQEQLGMPDSARYYYQMSANIAPQRMNERAKYVYALERLTRPLNKQAADSLLEEIADLYPLTEYAASARLTLGYTDEAIIDTVAELFASAESYRRVGDFTNAIARYRQLVTSYPKNALAPRSLYSIGWTHERKLFDNTTAISVYKELIEKYPDSEYAKEVAISVEFAQAAIAGANIDSMTQARRPAKPIQTEKGVEPAPDNLKISPTELLNRQRLQRERAADSAFAPVSAPDTLKPIKPQQPAENQQQKQPAQPSTTPVSQPSGGSGGGKP